MTFFFFLGGGGELKIETLCPPPPRVHYAVSTIAMCSQYHVAHVATKYQNSIQK